MEIRTIRKEDYEIVDQLIREAFTNSEHGYGNEAELVGRIRKSKAYVAELEVVAVETGTIIGHGLLSEVNLIDDEQKFIGLVLAPLAIKTSHQGLGTGTKLMKELEQRAQALDYPFISILGHPDYYPKFGYLPASQFNVKAPFDVPDEAFMLKELHEKALEGKQGTITYSEAFDES